MMEIINYENCDQVIVYIITVLNYHQITYRDRFNYYNNKPIHAYKV